MSNFPSLTHFQFLESFPLERDTDKTCVSVALDVAGQKMNVFWQPVFDDLERVIEYCETHNVFRVDFSSAKINAFAVGANVKEFAKIQTDKAIQEFMAYGQRVYRLLEESSVISVAYVAGACLGGGLEFAMACDYRLATRGEKVSLGMPETKLGLIPGWAGTQRLPELVGLQTAIEMLVHGELMNVDEAVAIQLIDVVVDSPTEFRETASQFDQPRPASAAIEEQQGALSILDSWLAQSDWTQSQRAVLECVRTGIEDGRLSGMQAERERFYELLQSDQAQTALAKFVNK